MGLTILNGGALEFSARIDLEEFQKDEAQLLDEFQQLQTRLNGLSENIRLNPHLDTKDLLAEVAQIEVALSESTAKGFDTGRMYQQLDALRKNIATRPVVIPITVDTKSATESIETLRAKMLIKQQAVVETTDITKAAALNKEIQALESQISKVSNAGKSGFDEVGNAIEKSGTKLNILSKGFGFLRQAAYILPGIGIAGIFNLIGEGAIALVQSLYKGASAFDAIADKIKLYNEVSKEANKQAAGQLVDAKVLYDVAINTANAMNVRVNAVKALKAEFPDYFKGISNEAILNGQAKKSYDDLTTSILATARAQAARSKLIDIEGQLLDIDNQKQKINTATFNEKQRAQDRQIQFASGGTGGVGGTELKQTKEEQQAIIEERRKAAIKEQDDKKARLQAQADFLVKFAGGENQLATVIEKADGIFKDKIEKENKLIAERLRLIEQLNGLRHDGIDAGLPKELSILDQINEKYDKMREAVIKFNAEVDKAKDKDKVPKLSVAEVETLRSVELNNTMLKQQADAYLKSLEDQKQAFTQFEEAKKQIGITKANELFAAQTKGQKTYLDFLKNEAKPLVGNILTGNFDAGTLEKIRGLSKAIGDETKKQQADQSAAFVKLLTDAATYSDKREALEDKYHSDVSLLEKERTKLTKAEYDQTSAYLKQKLNNDLQALAAAVVRQGPLYQRLGRDLVTFQVGALKDEIQVLETELENSIFLGLTPQMQSDIQARINSIKSLIENTDKASIKAKQTSDALASVGNGLSSIAGEIGSVNKVLGDTLSLIGQMTTQMAGVMKSVHDLNSDKFSYQNTSGKTIITDMAGEIAAIQNVATELIQIGVNIVKGFQGMKQQAKDAKTELADFNTQVATGEIEINLLYRDRLRTQLQINEATLSGLRQAQQLLQQQASQNTAEFNRVLAQLQQEQFISGKKITHPGGQIFGIGNTKVVDEFASLAGLNYDQLEKLFVSGQLTDKAKELFQELQKLKQEGVDIDSELKQVADNLNQIFTGTTAQNIADAIAQGFKQGKRTVADFANDFQSLMQDAIISSFEAQQIAPAMQEFYAQFASLSQSGGQLTADEIKQLKKIYDADITKFNQQLQDIQRATGIGLGSNGSAATANNLITGVKQLQEQTGELIAGQLGGIRLTALQQLELSRQVLDYNKRIEANTFRTADNTAIAAKILEGIRDGTVKITWR